MTNNEGQTMTSISVEEAQAKLSELIAQLGPGEELEITQDQRTIAKLVGQKKQRTFGLGKGKLTIVSEDDEHLEDFKEYMQ
jgi:antitoxin (DNA-binding transcriptional repressor) of toxin-antitoxin stability system